MLSVNAGQRWCSSRNPVMSVILRLSWFAVTDFCITKICYSAAAKISVFFKISPSASSKFSACGALQNFRPAARFKIFMLARFKIIWAPAPASKFRRLRRAQNFRAVRASSFSAPRRASKFIISAGAETLGLRRRRGHYRACGAKSRATPPRGGVAQHNTWSRESHSLTHENGWEGGSWAEVWRDGRSRTRVGRADHPYAKKFENFEKLAQPDTQTAGNVRRGRPHSKKS